MGKRSKWVLRVQDFLITGSGLAATECFFTQEAKMHQSGLSRKVMFVVMASMVAAAVFLGGCSAYRGYYYAGSDVYYSPNDYHRYHRYYSSWWPERYYY